MIISKPVISAVSGYAVAGGLELSLLGDIRVVEEDAVFGVFCRRWGVPLIDGGWYCYTSLHLPVSACLYVYLSVSVHVYLIPHVSKLTESHVNTIYGYIFLFSSVLLSRYCSITSNHWFRTCIRYDINRSSCES